MARKPFNFRQNEDLKQQDSVKTTSFSRNNDASSLVEEEEEEVVVCWALLMVPMRLGDVLSVDF